MNKESAIPLRAILLVIGAILIAIGVGIEVWWAVAIGGMVLLFTFLGFTTVEEGTAKAVMKLGKFQKIIFQWEGHWMDKNWNIWREKEDEIPAEVYRELYPDMGEKEIEEKRKKPSEEDLKLWRLKEEKKIRGRIAGGLWFYGLWPIHRIHTYPLRWTELHRIAEKERSIEKVQFHEETLDRVLLKPAVYWTKIFVAETVPPERIPVDVEVLVTMKVFNPYEFLFVAPPTPIEDILARIDALIRERIAHLTVDELLQVKAEMLWEGWKARRDDEEIEIPALKEEKLIKETLEKWGVKIVEKGVDIKRIDLPPEYSAALAREKQLTLEARARKVEAEIDAVARGAKIMGTVIEAIATATGKPRKEIEEEFSRDPEAFYKKHKVLINNTMSKLSWEDRAGVRIETPGAKGALGDFLRLIAAWQRMPMGEGKMQKGGSEINKRIEEAKRTYKEGQTFKTSKKG
jgi:regulator of protease activity HflC (stomatin/prohibitin superfamily)